MTENVEVPGYKLIRKLGEGGMATVYLALQESLDREVALKIMSPALAANENFCEQFMKEGRIAARLTHPHLMTVHDIGSQNGIYYLASEYLPAGTLRERMTAGLSTAEALEIARDIASGLSYAHEKGFVHRDVKPGNIMFRANGTAVLADFGIAKAIKSVSAATMAGNAIGTPDYMSPEQAQASPVDGRSDLYSLGAVMHECLSGRKPYQASDAYAVALMHVTEPVPKLPENIAWLQPLIDGLMAKNPDQRFANGEEFIQASDRLLQSHPRTAASIREQGRSRRRAANSTTGAPEDTAISQPVRSVAPTRRLWLAGGALAAVIIAIGAGAWYATHRSAASSSSSASPASTSSPVPMSVSEADINPAVTAMHKMDLATLLKNGDQYLAHGLKHYGERLDFPPGENATDMFHEALKRDPGNKRALQGLAKEVAFYIDGVRLQMRNGYYSGAENLIDNGLRADPKNQELLQLRQQVARARKNAGQ